MYWPLWTSLIVAMHDDIENTYVRDRSCNNSHESINCVTDRVKASILHTRIGAGRRNASQLILIMEWPNIT